MMRGIQQFDSVCARESMRVELSEFRTPDIIIVLSNIVILVVTLFFHIRTHCTDCRGQFMTKSKRLDGQTYTREAKLSIHDMPRPVELQNLTHS